MQNSIFANLRVPDLIIFFYSSSHVVFLSRLKRFILNIIYPSLVIFSISLNFLNYSYILSLSFISFHENAKAHLKRSSHNSRIKKLASNNKKKNSGRFDKYSHVLCHLFSFYNSAPFNFSFPLLIFSNQERTWTRTNARYISSLISANS